MKIEDFKKIKIDYMKKGDKDAVSALNALISKLMLTTIEKRASGEELSDADIVSILKKTEKEISEEKQSFESAGRMENVASLTRQAEVIGGFIPKMMSDEEIAAVINSLEDKSIPSIMKVFKTEYAGKCDMRQVSTIAKNIQG